MNKHIKTILLLFLLLIGFKNTPTSFASASNGAGGLDSTFGTSGKVFTGFGDGYSVANAVALQPDGKIVAAGNNGSGMFVLSRYSSDGSLDGTFGTGGKIKTSFAGSSPQENCRAVIIQPDGKIVAVGDTYNSTTSMTSFAIARYTTNGTLDSTFDSDGKVTTHFDNLVFAKAAAIQANGKIIVVGGIHDASKYYRLNFIVARYNTNGSLDTTFGTNGQVITRFGDGQDVPNAVVIQPNGKILVTGSVDGTESFHGYQNIALVRYNTDGSFDTSFGVGGRVKTPIIEYGSVRDSVANSISLQADGKIVVAGTLYAYSNPKFVAVRYNLNGSLDTTFDHDGIIIPNFGGEDYAKAVAIQSNGKILIAGYTKSTHLKYSRFALTRYNSNGLPDITFGRNGEVVTFFDISSNPYAIAEANAMVIQPNGKIILAGSREINNIIHFALTRYDIDLLQASFVSNAEQDGWILESSELSEEGGSLNAGNTTLRLGDDRANRQYRAILSFNTASLPDTAYVQTAELKIKESGGFAGTNPFNILGKLLIEIDSEYIGSTPSLTLDDFNAIIPHTAAGFFIKQPVDGWHTGVIQSSLSSIDKNDLTQFRLYFKIDDNNNHVSDYIDFFSGNASNVSYRPQLILRYYVPK